MIQCGEDATATQNATIDNYAIDILRLGKSHQRLVGVFRERHIDVTHAHQ